MDEALEKRTADPRNPKFDWVSSEDIVIFSILP